MGCVVQATKVLEKLVQAETKACSGFYAVCDSLHDYQLILCMLELVY